MKKEVFYQEFGNTPLDRRDSVLTTSKYSSIMGMTLSDIYKEISEIDDKLRNDEIRRDELLSGYTTYLMLKKDN